jgi:hypothetical protein
MIGTSEKAVPEISDLEWRLAYSQAARMIPKEIWYRKRDERAIAGQIPLERWKLVSANIKHLSSLIGQLVELRNADDTDEYGLLRAHEQAYNQASHLLIDAAIVAAPEHREIPHGCVSTDAGGGIRIEWVRPTSSVHLVVPATSTRAPYIYHEVGTTYVTEPASAERLAHWLLGID